MPNAFVAAGERCTVTLPLALASMDGPVFEAMARMVEQLAAYDDATLNTVNELLLSTWSVLDEHGRQLAGMSDEELHASAAAWGAQHGALLADAD